MEHMMNITCSSLCSCLCSSLCRILQHQGGSSLVRGAPENPPGHSLGAEREQPFALERKGKKGSAQCAFPSFSGSPLSFYQCFSREKQRR